MSAHFTSSSNASDSLGLVADWTHALNDNGDLAEVLERLMSLVKADATLIVRISKSDQRASYVARGHVEAGKIWPTLPETQAEATLGDCMSSAKVGSIWRLSDRMISDLTVTTDGRGASNVVEAVVCPLETANGYTDFLELHFQRRPAEHDVNLVIMLIGTLASSWRRRAPGSVSKRLNQKRKLTIETSTDGAMLHLLDVENPAHLSRSEFRVCSMLKEGMTVNVIADTLSIGPATVRSHLSSIFSKTGLSSQVELLHHLNKSQIADTPAPANDHIYGRG